MPEKGKIVVFRVAAAENNKFGLDKIRPTHLPRILTAMLQTEIKKVETGVFDASPLITRQVYSQDGLITDVPFHLLGTAWSRLKYTGLLRPRDRS